MPARSASGGSITCSLTHTKFRTAELAVGQDITSRRKIAPSGDFKLGSTVLPLPPKPPAPWLKSKLMYTMDDAPSNG